MPSMPFRFNEELHEYRCVLTGQKLPHITGLLLAGGEIDDRWFTEESCERGKAVHKLTADFDLGALDPVECVSAYKGWLLGHAKLMSIVRPEWLAVEEPRAHGCLRFAGRPDRVGRAWGLACVWEIKSGDPEKSHQIQTALQAILAADELGIPPTAVARFAEYVDGNGKSKVEEHKNPRNFTRAYELIQKFGR